MNRVVGLCPGTVRLELRQSVFILFVFVFQQSRGREIRASYCNGLGRERGVGFLNLPLRRAAVMIYEGHI